MIIPEQAVAAAHRKLRELFGAVSIHVAEELVRVVLTSIAAQPLMGVQRPEDVAQEAEIAGALRSANDLIDMIEGPFGWATATNAQGFRLKDDETYVTAYLAVREAMRALSAPQSNTCPKCQRAKHDWDCAEDNCPMAALPHTGQPQEGWQLVPVEPTERMLVAARDVRDALTSDSNSDATYRAMLAASLPPPVAESGWQERAVEIVKRYDAATAAQTTPDAKLMVIANYGDLAISLLRTALPAPPHIAEDQTP